MITIGYSTRKHNPQYKEYLQKTCMYKEVEIIEKINNGEKSLSQVYNEILKESNNDIVVLCHDDLEFDTNKWGDKVLKNFEKNPEYGILGLAGTKYLDSSTQWWKLPTTMYGIVNHKSNGKKWTSTYSQNINDKIEETIIVDGLFIAINKNKIKHNFDETIEGFHFYDLGFCLPNYLDGVKIGVMFNNRVTHLSVGQTNQQWELNRQKFSERYKNTLPIDITQSDKNCDTFVFVHDQSIILEFEKNNKFKNIKDFKYVFLGNRDISKIKDLKNLIVARNFEHNLELYPLFTSFTGWYLLWKNNLITKKYVNLFEYDINTHGNIQQIQSKFFYDEFDMVGYIPFPASHFQYIKNKPFVEGLFLAIKKTYKVDFEKFLEKLIKNNPNLLWSSTSNVTFKTEVFLDFMKWFEPLINEIKDDKYCGHFFERAISFYYFMKNKKVALANNILQHLQMNSHETQPHNVNYEDSMKKLTTNIY